MAKYKVCPVCGAHNNPLFLECSECETDLQNVPVVDEEMEHAASESAEKSDNSPKASDTPRMVRVCDCGAKNPVQARRCQVCGDDISMIMPTPDTEEQAPKFVLSSIDGKYAFDIHPGHTIIGRENAMKEYLASKPFVSRKHAELILSEDNRLTIKNCNATNFTFVNNEEIQADLAVELHNGDEIGLGGNVIDGERQEEAAYFTVRIGSCT